MRKKPLLSKELLVRLYEEEHRSLAYIASVTDTNYRWVRDSFIFHGMSWRTKKESRVFHPPVSQETKDKIAQGRIGCKDTPEVAEKKRKILETAGGRGWNKGLTAATDERVARQITASTKAMQDPTLREYLSKLKIKQIQTGSYYIRGYHESPKAGRVYYMSGWELRRYKELDKDETVVFYKVQPLVIPYIYKESKHRYIPDVLITYRDTQIVLEEIKPERIVKQALVKNNKIAHKIEAGRKYAFSKGWGWRIVSATGRKGEGPFISV